MAAGKGKKKNVTGTLPRKPTKSPAPGPKKTGGTAGRRKTPRGTTRRSGEK
jgi:hypothetical protein